MNKNENGSSLITVLLIALVFSVLGLAIVASSIGGAKRVENRESDVLLTYDGVQTVEKLTTDIAIALDSFHFLDFQSEINFQKIVKSNEYEKALNDIFKNIISNYEKKDEVKSLDIKEVDFGIEKEKDFTRVYDIELVTNNPNKQEGQIHRTIQKRIILSPIPSFLKYAVGSSSQESGLVLNGSPNIVGNVYANNLEINPTATYEEKSGKIKNHKTEYPSIIGDLYSSSTKILPFLTEKNFYNNDIPDLKHDSQFVNIDFDESFNDRVNYVLKQIEHFRTRRIGQGTEFPEELVTDIQHYRNYSYTLSDQNGMLIVGSQSYKEELEPADKGIEYKINHSNDSLTIEDVVKVKGDLFITVEKNSSVSIKNDLVVDGDLYISNYGNLTLKNVFVTGDVHLINFSGETKLNNGRFIAAGNIIIESYAENNNEVSSVEVNNEIISGENVSINSYNTKIQINHHMFINGALTISGDEDVNEQDDGENDEVIFHSVVYVGGKTFISNVNILGANNNKGQLVLLSKGELVLTRFNEFKNYQTVKETGKPYLPIEGDIQPLKAFFYTEDRAELYGVGSLFYIHGGIFAKNKLEINALRGKVGNTIDDLPLPRIGELSRFIVQYNENVFFDQIDALPIVKKLQVISDRLLIN